ncbi:MAG: EsaB/YukD family protein [Bacillota bacterium]
MDRVIVSVKIKNSANTQDLEVPVYIPAKELARMIVKVLTPSTSTTDSSNHFSIKADPPGRILEDNETLADAGVWDGSYITII